MDRTITVEITVKVPSDASERDVLEWLRYATGCNGDIPMSNPLHDRELEATSVAIRRSPR